MAKLTISNISTKIVIVAEYSKVDYYSITLVITDSSKVIPKYCDCFIT